MVTDRPNNRTPAYYIPLQTSVKDFEVACFNPNLLGKHLVFPHISLMNSIHVIISLFIPAFS